MSCAASKAVQATLNFFERTDALLKWYSSLDRVRDGLVWLAESVVAMISQGMEFRCGSCRRDGGNRMARRIGPIIETTSTLGFRKDTGYLVTESMHLKSSQGYSLSYKPTISLPFSLSRIPVITISGVKVDRTSSRIRSNPGKGASHSPPIIFFPNQLR